MRTGTNCWMKSLKNSCSTRTSLKTRHEGQSLVPRTMNIRREDSLQTSTAASTAFVPRASGSKIGGRVLAMVFFGPVFLAGASALADEAARTRAGTMRTARNRPVRENMLRISVLSVRSGPSVGPGALRPLRRSIELRPDGAKGLLVQRDVLRQGIQELLGMERGGQDTGKDADVRPPGHDAAEVDHELRGVVDDVREIDVDARRDALVDRELELRRFVFGGSFCH